MRTPDVVTVTVVTLLAGAGGLLLGGPVGLGVGVILGALTGWLTVRAQVRPVVVIVIVAGAVGGALAGDGIVRALCFPGSCTALAGTASALTGVATAIGVGLVMALVIRSFDEFQEGAGRRPTPTGTPDPGASPETATVAGDLSPADAEPLSEPAPETGGALPDHGDPR